MGKRSRRIEMSREAQVLRSMRLDREFLMRKTADLLGVSSTTINHVEIYAGIRSGRIQLDSDEDIQRKMKDLEKSIENR